MRKIVFYGVSTPNEDGSISQFDSGETAQETGYSDRLWRENPRKYDELCKKHFGDISQYWGSREPEKIELFLRDFLGKPVILCRISEYAHKITDYPYWRFDFRYPENGGSEQPKVGELKAD